MFFNTSPDALFIPPATVDPVGFGKVAIVTGCGSGVGLACAQLLLAHQYQVCGLDARAFDYGLIQEADHGRFHFHRADLTGPGACEDGVYAAVASFGGRIDLLVNVAGVMDTFSSVDGLTDAEWDRVMAVNLTVPVRMMRAVIPFMREKKSGSIVNVASTAGVSGAVAGIAYTCSKHGLVGATKNVAWRFRKEGIRCNAVLPGAVDSRIGKAIAAGHGDEYDAEAYAQVEPVHALHAQASESTPDITPLEVAQAVVFLATDQARTINGVSLPIDQAWNVI
ncbi:short-chain dehydrogenase/reductase SDR [Colletotrichum tofieldiae]|uniref:3-oxoacyl-[acyl-carrier-protein] reductase n=1 Tax=Colletotrichum tofieldiae TaxID=708197 RepID=A0A166Q0G5_9PEZI|nr:short-chain dehydrogenase/reductase SDR [Colletotrichum tofieldiae]GKT53605.1 short-chain dehydrogenase/reductase SDR [Colletotrichum tofieldiae]GKT73355.1 short-chain dehydrogenase/reductase SDR [Colletotrichum tofieldiae]